MAGRTKQEAPGQKGRPHPRSEEHTSELQSPVHPCCPTLLSSDLRTIPQALADYRATQDRDKWLEGPNKKRRAKKAARIRDRKSTRLNSSHPSIPAALHYSLPISAPSRKPSPTIAPPKIGTNGWKDQTRSAGPKRPPAS